MYSVKHIDQKLGLYHALSHGRVKDLDATDLFRKNTEYLELLRKKGREVFSQDGYGNVAEVTMWMRVLLWMWVWVGYRHVCMHAWMHTHMHACIHAFRH